MAHALAVELVENAVIADRFRLVRKLGRGGMGSVWLAHHLGLDVPCAIKFIDADLRQHPEIRARLEREAKAEAQLRSPHVVQIFDHGIWNDAPYIVMEYLQGESLAARLERVGRLDPEGTHRLVAHVARALNKAHALGIVHRDLKPENIFLIEDDEGEIAKVVDFGVAKIARADWVVDRVTKDGLLVGTPLYMSPEQARGTDDVDYRSDLWSLAVIAFQCLTGMLPFYSEGLGDLLAKIMFEPLPQPSAIAPELPPTFDAWWERGAARDRTHRFQSAKELADSLAQALGISGGVHVATVPPGGRASMVSLAEIRASQVDLIVPSGSTASSVTADLSAATSLWGRSFLAWGRSWLAPRYRRALVFGGATLVGFIFFLVFSRAKPPPPPTSSLEGDAIEAPPAAKAAGTARAGTTIGESQGSANPEAQGTQKESAAGPAIAASAAVPSTAPAQTAPNGQAAPSGTAGAIADDTTAAPLSKARHDRSPAVAAPKGKSVRAPSESGASAPAATSKSAGTGPSKTKKTVDFGF